MEKVTDESKNDDPTDDTLLPTHYVGIGASAGGLEALQLLFEHVPLDAGISYIVVQHLSPDFKSIMAELLAKYTSMPIYNVQDTVKVKPDSLYLIPPRKNMMIAEGRLLLSDQMPNQGIKLPIDVFLRSLAEDQQHRAIAIILSGTGSDGSRGVKAIKEAGGLVIVQEPSSAKFDGMPYSAVNTGLADLVLPAELIGAQLLSYLRHPLISGHKYSLRDHISSNEDVMVEVFSLLKSKSDIDFSQYKPSTVARRIERRMGINQLTELGSYLSLLMQSSKELQMLAKELLIGVTRFFRDEEVYEHLEKHEIASVVSQVERTDNIRVWVAGCSTGEEAYSIAILFDEYLRQHNLNINLKLFATDVDGEAIVEASAGRYSEDIAYDVSPERLQRYFIKKGSHYEVVTELRQMVIFAAHNMIKDPPFSNIDLVSCRNVLIYFQHTIQKKTLSAFHFALKKDGVLLLGSSETLGDLKGYFSVIDERCKIYRKLSHSRIQLGSLLPIKENRRVAPGSLPAVGTLIRSHRNLQRASPFEFVKDRLIADWVPDCVLLNEARDAVHAFGDVSVYMKKFATGKVSNNISDIVVDDLAIAVNTALTRAEKTDEQVHYKNVGFNHQGKAQLVNLHVYFMRESAATTASAYFALIFEKVDIEALRGEGDSDVQHGEAFNAQEYSQRRIQDLEHELMKKQEHLQVAVEELETTNEELQSSNEELMSANEELQSTNEELQSVNEELFTVNSEFQEKIDELTIVNRDLDNVLASTSIGMIFLDNALLIRRFTQVASFFVHVLPSDIGRPFHHLSHQLEYPDLFADVFTVVQTGKGISKDVVSHRGVPLLVQIRPTDTTAKGGVVVTISDMSQHRVMLSSFNLAHQNKRSVIQAQAQQESSSEYRVLVVDDSPADCRILLNLLADISMFTVRATEVHDVTAAMDLCAQELIDVCLVDYRMGHESALDFIYALNGRGIVIPVIVMSGHAKSELEHALLASEMCGFLNKDDLSSAVLQRSILYAVGFPSEQTGDQHVESLSEPA
ncbi:MAG: chemotaxis protein CheB [Gammaproteobacteria bacterium]